MTFLYLLHLSSLMNKFTQQKIGDHCNSQQENDQLDIHSVEVLAEAISKAIGESKGDKRFIDITKIPLICLSVTNIHRDIREIKDMMVTMKTEMTAGFVRNETFSPVQKIVYGLVSLILIAVVGAVIALVLNAK